MRTLLIDGETCETYRNEKGQLETSSGQAYDLGGGVLDTDAGELLTKFSFVNEDVFFGMPQSMENAYFADKIPQYLEDMRMGKRTILNTWKIWQNINQMCQTYKVDAIAGHNIWFDVKVLNATIRYQTKSKKRYFLPYGVPIIDTMKMARMVIANTEEYIDFCLTNNYMTAHEKPRPRVTAEILWRFLSGDNNFQEAHTGLEDVEIEAKIYMECLKRGYPFPELAVVSEA